MENDTPIVIFNYIRIFDSFPNVYIAYRIMLMIPVIVDSVERSLSKLKLKNLILDRKCPNKY